MSFPSTDPLLNIELPKLRRRHGEVYWIDFESPVDGLSGLVVRGLNRQEFLQIEKDQLVGLDVAESVIEQCTVYPDLDWQNPDNNPLFLLPYHAFDQIAEQIISLSGYNDPNRFAELIGEGRDHCSSLFGFMDAVIMKNLPGYKREDLEKMTLIELTKVYAVAETSLEEQFDFRLFLDPEYAAKVAAKEKKQQQKQQGQGFVPGRNQVPPPPQGWESSHSDR